MKSTILSLLGLAATTTTTLAAPVPQDSTPPTYDSGSPSSNSSIPPHNLSYLRTQLISGPSRFENLYVTSYHTGAGFSDATLQPKADYTARGFLNGTSWQFDLGTEFPWGLNIYGDTNYAAWEPVTIDAGESRNPGFFFNETAAPGLLWGSEYGNFSYEESEFRNWLACDWSHGVPQLFWHYRFYNYSIPETCATVWLIPEVVRD